MASHDSNSSFSSPANVVRCQLMDRLRLMLCDLNQLGIIIIYSWHASQPAWIFDRTSNNSQHPTSRRMMLRLSMNRPRAVWLFVAAFYDRLVASARKMGSDRSSNFEYPIIFECEFGLSRPGSKLRSKLTSLAEL